MAAFRGRGEPSCFTLDRDLAVALHRSAHAQEPLTPSVAQVVVDWLHQQRGMCPGRESTVNALMHLSKAAVS